MDTKDNRDSIFTGGPFAMGGTNGHRFFVIHVTTPIRDFEQPGFYWWRINDEGKLVKSEPYPTAEGAYLAAIGD